MALDRIQIGDVKRSEGVQAQQGIYDCLRLRAFAKTRLHRSVFRAPALARVHHLPFQQINDRYQVQLSHGMKSEGRRAVNTKGHEGKTKVHEGKAMNHK